MFLKQKAGIRLAILVAVLLLGIISTSGLVDHLLGSNLISLPTVHPVFAQTGPNVLGITCALGASQPGLAFPTPISTKDGDTTNVNSSCDWAGDIDGDGVLDPLVSDNPGLSPAGTGGGFIADIVATGLNTSINGFDQTINYDTKVLNAVLIDQSGLMYGGNNGCLAGNSACTLTTAFTLNQSIGQVRVAQALLGATSGPGGNCNTTVNPSCTSVNQELFRIRFDIVGAGTGFINFSTDPTMNVITTPSALAHTTQNGSFGTDSLFQLLNSQTTGSFVDSWSFSPNPEVLGSSLTFTAVAATCSYCTAPFTYSWDFSSQDSATYVAKTDATGTTVTVTAPPPVINRVTLTVTDSAAHHIVMTKRLPLAAIVTGPTTIAQGTASTAFTGKWLGGVVTTSSGYSGLWRLCPGTALSHPVCTSGPVLISQSPGSITQTSTAPAPPATGVTWNFAGYYNNFMSISDTAVSQISATSNTIVAPAPINVTGSTQAYTVAVSPSATSINAGQSVTFTATVTYSATPLYPAASQSTA